MSKRKSPKKRLPKRFASDYINTSKGIDPVRTAAHEVYQYNERLRSLGREEGIPETKGRSHNLDPDKSFNPRTNITTYTKQPLPRTQARNRLAEMWQTERLQGFTEAYRGRKLEDWKGVTLFLWFSGPRWWLVKESSLMTARSFAYPSATAAEQAWLLDKIQWEEITTKNL